VFTVKKTQLYTTFWFTGSCPCANIHIQGRVCVSTQISRLCHVHAQVHTKRHV